MINIFILLIYLTQVAESIQVRGMIKLIGYCGNACYECGAYTATIQNDEAKRDETAKAWSRKYNTNIQPEDIYCSGCASLQGRLFIYCRVCQIRRCVLNKGVSSCGECLDYPCEVLKIHFERVPEAKKRLDLIKNNTL